MSDTDTTIETTTTVSDRRVRITRAIMVKLAEDITGSPIRAATMVIGMMIGMQLGMNDPKTAALLAASLRPQDDDDDQSWGKRIDGMAATVGAAMAQIDAIAASLDLSLADDDDDDEGEKVIEVEVVQPQRKRRFVAPTDTSIVH